MFWILSVIPLLFPIIVKVIFHSKINYQEWAIQTVIGFVVVALLYNVGKYNQFSDYEIWNGEVTNKEMIQRNCPWGWRDSTDSFCTEYTTRRVPDGESCSGTGVDRKCTTNYKTQYNYIYSWERKWFVYSNIKESWQIARIDRQGANEPPRWTQVSVGDPVSRRNHYENYVKAAESSVFHKDRRLAEQYREFIPEYPINLYDYYRVDRVITSPDVVIPNIAEYNILLPKILKEIGPSRQGNIVLLFTDIADKSYANAVINAWQGGKKNDSIIIIGVDSTQAISWLHVHSWSKNKLYDVMVRDMLLDLGRIDNAQEVIDILYETSINYFERQSMKEFEYLKDEVEPSNFMIGLILVITLLLSGGLTFFFHKHDIDFFKR